MFTLLISLALAGSDADITTGVVLSQQGDHAQAIEKLQKGLEDPSQLKAKNVAKGWLTLSTSLLHEARVEESAQALRKAREADDGKLAKAIERQADVLANAALRGALGLIQEAQRAAAPADQVLLLETAERLASIAAEQGATRAMALDLRAQARDQLGRKDEAAADFAAVLDLHESSPPEKPDLLVAYAAYRLALIQRYEREDLVASLATIQRGQALLEKEWQRLGQDDQYAELYTAAREDLKAFELDIYLNSPDLLETALKKFEAAVAEEPDNAVLLLAYGQLLEQKEAGLAIPVYVKAIELGGATEHMANFNLAAIYVNRAAEFSKAANLATSDAEYLPAVEGMQLAMAQAKPFLDRAHELEPQDRETLRALKQVCINLEDMACYEEARSKLDALP